MNIPELKIGELIASTPIIQGGMGIGVSGAKLAAAVANEGGIGVISGVQIGYRDPDFLKNPIKANIKALKEEIQKARKLSPNGIIGINFMVAMKNYSEYVKTAINEKIDLIISGAGLPLDLPKIAGDSKTKLVPIVSSGKAAKVILKRWEKDNRLPDAIIVEGPLAGGHLGFKADELFDEKNKLENILKDVLEVVKTFEDAHNVTIPVIAAGGIINGADIGKMLSLGASGVQMGTAFVTTEECDACSEFKETYLNAEPEDVEIIKSPVGMPGRAIHNSFLDKLKSGGIPVKKCFKCMPIESCNPAEAFYCISKALIDSVKGEEGLVFCGARVGEIKEIVSVKELMTRLKKEISEYKE